MSHEVYIDGVRYIPEPTEPDTPEPAGERWFRALSDLEDDKPSGAWGKLNGGIKASREDVDFNRSRLLGDWYVTRVAGVANAVDIPPWLLLGIFDRESNHGRSLDSNGNGDRGNAFGVGQVDKRYHTQLGRPDPYDAAHMRQCADILCGYLSEVEKKHPEWPDKYILKGAVVAYNSGVGNVATIENMDVGTTGNDYGADTCARAKYWERFFV